MILYAVADMKLTSATHETRRTYTTSEARLRNVESGWWNGSGSLRVIRRVRVAGKYRVMWNTREVADRTADTKRARIVSGSDCLVGHEVEGSFRHRVRRRILRDIVDGEVSRPTVQGVFPCSSPFSPWR